jgi:hypothetical protein
MVWLGWTYLMFTVSTSTSCAHGVESDVSDKYKSPKKCHF